MFKRFAFRVVLLCAVISLGLPFVGGGGPSLFGASASYANAETGLPIFASAPLAAEQTASVARVAPRTDLKSDTEHLAQKPVPKPLPKLSSADRASGTAARMAAFAAAGRSCPGNVGGSPGGAPGVVSAGGVPGTTSGDLQSFAVAFNQIRVANCLHPIPMSNFRYDSCMQARLFWMAEDPSPNPLSAWGHTGVSRSDGLPVVGCDGNLAAGTGMSGAGAASKWWASTAHRNSLYRPGNPGATGGVCIYFAATHGGIPNEPYSYMRAAARWGGC